PQPPAQPAPNFGDFGGGAGVGSSVGLNSPNLFGDVFGARTSQMFVKQFQAGFLNGKTFVASVTGVSGNAPGQISGNIRNGTLSLRDATGQNLVPVPSISIMGLPMPVSNPILLRALGIKGSFTEMVPVGPNT